MKNFSYKIAPFFVLGITIFIFIIGIIILSYILIFGALIGLVLFVIKWIRDKLSSKSVDERKKVSKSGRVIDHDDL
jgi:hypothetical protein